MRRNLINKINRDYYDYCPDDLIAPELCQEERVESETIQDWIDKQIGRGVFYSNLKILNK